MPGAGLARSSLTCLAEIFGSSLTSSSFGSSFFLSSSPTAPATAPAALSTAPATPFSGPGARFLTASAALSTVSAAVSATSWAVSTAVSTTPWSSSRRPEAPRARHVGLGAAPASAGGGLDVGRRGSRGLLGDRARARLGRGGASAPALALRASARRGAGAEPRLLGRATPGPSRARRRVGRLDLLGTARAGAAGGGHGGLGRRPEPAAAASAERGPSTGRPAVSTASATCGLGDVARLALAGLRERLLGGGALGGLGGGLLLGLAAGALLGLALLLRGGLGARLLLLGAEARAALLDHVADRVRDQRAGTDRVVVAGDHVVDPVGVAPGSQPRDDVVPVGGVADGAVVQMPAVLGGLADLGMNTRALGNGVLPLQAATSISAGLSPDYVSGL